LELHHTAPPLSKALKPPVASNSTGHSVAFLQSQQQQPAFCTCSSTQRPKNRALQSPSNSSGQRLLCLLQLLTNPLLGCTHTPSQFFCNATVQEGHKHTHLTGPSTTQRQVARFAGRRHQLLPSSRPHLGGNLLSTSRSLGSPLLCFCLSRASAAARSTATRSALFLASY